MKFLNLQGQATLFIALVSLSFFLANARIFFETEQFERRMVTNLADSSRINEIRSNFTSLKCKEESFGASSSSFQLYQTFTDPAKHCVIMKTPLITADPGQAIPQTLNFSLVLQSVSSVSNDATTVYLCLDTASGFDNCYEWSLPPSPRPLILPPIHFHDIVRFEFQAEEIAILVGGIDISNEVSIFVDMVIVENASDEFKTLELVDDSGYSVSWTSEQTVNTGSVTKYAHQAALMRSNGAISRGENGFAVLAPYPMNEDNPMDISVACMGNIIYNEDNASHDVRGNSVPITPCAMIHKGFRYSNFVQFTDIGVTPSAFTLTYEAKLISSARFGAFPFSRAWDRPVRYFMTSFPHFRTGTAVEIHGWTEWSVDLVPTTFFTTVEFSQDSGADIVYNSSVQNMELKGLLLPAFRKPEDANLYDNIVSDTVKPHRAFYVSTVYVDHNNNNLLLGLVNPVVAGGDIQPLFTLSHGLSDGEDPLPYLTEAIVDVIVPFNYDIKRASTNIGHIFVSPKVSLHGIVWQFDLFDSPNNSATSFSEMSDQPSGIDWFVVPHDPLRIRSPMALPSETQVIHDVSLVDTSTLYDSYKVLTNVLSCEHVEQFNIYQFQSTNLTTDNDSPRKFKPQVFSDPTSTHFQLQSAVLSAGEIQYILNADDIETLDHLAEDVRSIGTSSSLFNPNIVEDAKETLKNKQAMTTMGTIHVVYSSYEIAVLIVPITSYIDSTVPKVFPLAHFTTTNLTDMMPYIKNGSLESSLVEPFRSVQLMTERRGPQIERHSLEFTVMGVSFSVPFTAFRKHFAAYAQQAYSGVSPKLSEMLADFKNVQLPKLKSLNTELAGYLEDIPFYIESLSVPLIISVLSPDIMGLSSNSSSNGVITLVKSLTDIGSYKMTLNGPILRAPFVFSYTGLNTSAPSVVRSFENGIQSPISPNLANFAQHTASFIPSDATKLKDNGGKIVHVVQQEGFLTTYSEDVTDETVNAVTTQGALTTTLCSPGYFSIGASCAIVPSGYRTSSDRKHLNKCDNNEVCPTGASSALPIGFYPPSSVGLSNVVPLSAKEVTSAADDEVYLEYIISSLSNVFTLVLIISVSVGIAGCQIGCFRDLLKRVDFITAGDHYIDNNPHKEDTKFDENDPKMANRQSILVLRSPVSGIVSIMVVVVCGYLAFRSFQFQTEYDSQQAGAFQILNGERLYFANEIDPVGVEPVVFKKNTRHDCYLKAEDLMTIDEKAAVSDSGLLHLKVKYPKESSISCYNSGKQILDEKRVQIHDCLVGDSSCNESMYEAIEEVVQNAELVGLFNVDANTCFLDIGALFAKKIEEHAIFGPNAFIEISIPENINASLVAVEFGFNSFVSEIHAVNPSRVHFRMPVETDRPLSEYDVEYNLSMGRAVTFVDGSKMPTSFQTSLLNILNPDGKLISRNSASQERKMRINLIRPDQSLVCLHAPAMRGGIMFAILILITLVVYEIGRLAAVVLLTIRDATEPIWSPFKRERAYRDPNSIMVDPSMMMASMYEEMAPTQMDMGGGLGAGPGVLPPGGGPPMMPPGLSLGGHRGSMKQSNAPPPPNGPPPLSMTKGAPPPPMGPPGSPPMF